MITYPLNNIDYTAEDAELYFSTRESGVYDGNDFEVTVSGIDNDVIVGSGIAWIHNTKFSGKVVGLKEPKTLTLSLPNSVYDRIDAIVVQFDANKNATEIIVKEGIASSSPVAPSVVRTESLYELHIFHAQRKAGATVISIDDLVDLRNDSDYCGIMFDPISSVDPTLTKNGYAADAKATGEAIKRATNVRNLLDNSDFRNPVNQRGQTSYTTKDYTIDRWDLRTSGVTINVCDGYIEISGSEGSNKYLRQKVANATKLVGKLVTASIKLKNGTVICSSGVMSTESTAVDIKFEDGANVGFLRVEAVSDDISAFHIIANSATVQIEWAALYEGEYTAETLPPYVPKDPAAELLNCQAHDVVFGSATESVYILSGIVNARTDTYIYFPVNVPTKMRVKPTVVTSGEISVVSVGLGSYYLDISGGSWAVHGYDGNVVGLTYTHPTSGVFTKGAAAVLRLGAGGKLELNANL